MSIKVTDSAVESNRMGKSAREEITTFQLNAEYTICNFHSVFIVMFREKGQHGVSIHFRDSIAVF